MKLLFLDIDGVCNGSNIPPYPKGWPEEHLELPLVQHLNEIIEQTGAKVVISSSWRTVLSREELAKVLALRGFVGEVIDVTPDLTVGSRQRMSEFVRIPGKLTRRDEIKSWMEDFDGEIEAFVILEDYESMKGLGDHLVQTDSNVGLTPKHVKRAIEILNEKPCDCIDCEISDEPTH